MHNIYIDFVIFLLLPDLQLWNLAGRAPIEANRGRENTAGIGGKP